MKTEQESDNLRSVKSRKPEVRYAIIEIPKTTNRIVELPKKENKQYFIVIIM